MNEIKRISINVSESDLFSKGMPSPMQFEGGGLLFCISGESEIIIDMKHYKLQKRDMAIIAPFTIAQLISPSDDFDGVIMGIGIEMLVSIKLANRSQYYTEIRDNPCITLTEKEEKKLLSLREIYNYINSDSTHPFREEIDESIFKIIFYETLAIYNSRTIVNNEECSRDDTIFANFITHLFNNYKVRRDLQYYAQMQNITAGHLSKVIKRVSKKTATSWVSGYTILNIKTQLQNRDITISSIVDEFNFPNNSFFSQYFKKYAGISPREYREGMKSTAKR